MNISHASGYVEREREITFQTSSGDEVSINLYKKNSTEINAVKDGDGLAGSFSFSQMEKFTFNVEGNGLTEQDRAEIDELMKKIEPLIEEFFNQDLDTPYNELVNKISTPIKELEESVKDLAKSILVDAFDTQVEKKEREDEKPITVEEKSEFEKFLEDILYRIEYGESPIYG